MQLTGATTVDDLPDDLAGVVADRRLIVFDGECVLCSAFFRFVLRRDRAGSYVFATAQSPLGARLYQALELDTRDFETNLVIINGRIFGHLDAFAAVMRDLGGVLWPLSLLRFLPSAIKRPMYFAVARNRYHLFGRYDQCMIPDAGLRSRFMQGGWT